MVTSCLPILFLSMVTSLISRCETMKWSCEVSLIIDHDQLTIFRAVIAARVMNLHNLFFFIFREVHFQHTTSTKWGISSLWKRSSAADTGWCAFARFPCLASKNIYGQSFATPFYLPETKTLLLLLVYGIGMDCLTSKSQSVTRGNIPFSFHVSFPCTSIFHVLIARCSSSEWGSTYL